VLYGEKLTARLAMSNGGHEVFTALNTAGFQDAAVVYVPRNQVVEHPIQVVYLSQWLRTSPSIASPRCLVVAEAGSASPWWKTFLGAHDGDHFTNSVTEIWADDNAQVTHVRLQREGRRHLSHWQNCHYPRAR
jgi:Fe-S cluster assembly protein SufD